MAYLEDHGTYCDVPLEIILTAWKRGYGEKRIRGWIPIYASAGKPGRDFYREDVLA